MITGPGGPTSRYAESDKSVGKYHLSQTGFDDLKVRIEAIQVIVCTGELTGTCHISVNMGYFFQVACDGDEYSVLDDSVPYFTARGSFTNQLSRRRVRPLRT